MSDAWPVLGWADWRATAKHLHLMTQVAGKVRLAHTPWLNHSWHVTLYPTARGLDTGPVPAGPVTVQLSFDLIDGRLHIASDRGETREVALRAGSIAGFLREVLAALDALGAPTVIDPMPSEIPGAVRMDTDDDERPFDADAARRFRRALLSVDRVFREFRTGFLGKASPAHFFWGSFDLAVTRFSGRAAPLHPGGAPGLPDDVTREAYSHEEASLGFWPGNDDYPHAAFYAYAWPMPGGYADAAVRPEGAAFDAKLGEFLLSYDAVRASPDPRAMLLDFARTTYAAAADLGRWDRAALECAIGAPGRPRTV
ncbi:MAG: hypothetical protein H0X36_06280 [Sphingomonadaceae bacterium]|nr:hypothetical protein [Sphingomonadaceae bacterium]